MTALAKFLRVATALLEFESSLDSTARLHQSIFAIEAQRDELKCLWERVKSTFDDCLDSIDRSCADAGDGISIAKDKYKECYSAYLCCAALLGDHANQSRTPVTHSSPIVSQPVDQPLPSHNIHLPPCDTELFYGDYLSWPTFRDMFTAIYVLNSRLTPVEKLFHLNQKTRGEAKDIVKKSPLTNDGFAQAWKNLSDRYENKRILVNSQLKVLFNLPMVSNESGSGLKLLQREINNCISALELHDIEVANWDAIFTYLCSTRLPDTTLSLWEQTLSDKTAIPRWIDLDKFLTNRFQTLETVSDIKGQGLSKPNRMSDKAYGPSSPRQFKVHHASDSRPGCKLCPNVDHAMRVCPKFLEMTVQERWSIARRYSLCLNCLATSHLCKDCKSTFSCNKCQNRHHSLLHQDNTKSKSQEVPPAAVTTHAATLRPSTTHFHSCFASKRTTILLGTAIVNVCHNGGVFAARALIDSGSEGTFVSERLVNRLRLSTSKINAQISGLNRVISAEVRKSCGLVISSPRSPCMRIETNALILPRLTGNLPTCPIDNSIVDALPNLELADKNFFRSDQVDILIGSDLYPQVILSGVKRNILGSLLAQETVFGWILTGPTPTNDSSTETQVVAYFNEVSLESQLSRFWELEEVPKERYLTPEEKFCEENYAHTTRRRHDGRYIVSLPFKANFPHDICLGQSRQSALRQFLRNESSLLKKPDFKPQYDAVIKEYGELKHMRKVSPPPFELLPAHYYLPHHAVFKPESTTTKIRVVFNASCPSSSKNSLNDVLYAGPVLQADITVLLMKWRMFRYVFNADIEKMYRQILVDPKHTPYQRIIFRESPNDAIQDYELDTVTFGVNCAPYLAIRTLIQLAEEVRDTLPLASDVLKNFMYVDDALAGAHDIATALKTRDELKAALSSAGFSLRKWTSNSRELLKDLPKEHLLKSDFLELDDSSVAKTLGIRWNALSDHFYFLVTPLELKNNYTKREVLSAIAKLFDPAGWLGPIIVVAKILMQRVWLDKTDWDEPLGSESTHHWKNFVENYVQISNIRLPRWTGFTPHGKIEFHGFCDASEKAYAAVLYIRVDVEGEGCHSHLLTAKTKVAPIKTVSLPRLELCGAALLADLIDFMLPQFRLDNYEVHLWTDSTIVLAWLRKPPCSWTTFVANSVSRIQEKVGNQQWHHVDSEDNPADLGSRGVTPQDLSNSDLWWKGPSWLSQDKIHWPQEPQNNEHTTSLECKPQATTCHILCQEEDILERFSSLHKAIRVLAYVFRFLNRTRKIFCSASTQLTEKEKTDVETRLISLCQKANFSTEIENLRKKIPINRKSSILALNPFIDERGVMRTGGRLAFSPSLTYDEKHPIILPYNCAYSRLLVRSFHLICLHGGNQLVLRSLRQRFWLIRAKNLIKTTTNNCKVCIVNRQQERKQLMSALPSARTTLSRPFSSTGVDFAGPFDIRNYTGRACLITKGYVCVFVCFATKAIHLEAVSDLSTSAFMAAFARFVSRRGCPTDVYSDNGTNFVGASKEIKRNFRAYLDSVQDAISSNTFPHHLKWHFIPAGAPHMGGLWEAGVKSFKFHFRRIAGQHKYTFEEFSTLLSRIEACLNSRPISPMSNDPTDLEPLTPGHFLIGSALLAVAEPEMTDNPISVVNRWQKLKALQHYFCERWKNEYLKELHKRVKWKYPQQDVVADDMVVIRGENLPPNEWRLGRIEKVHEGKDGHVRVATIRTTRGLITRPIVKLVMLPKA